MPRVVYQGQSHDLDGQSLLDCLTARGHAIPHGCRAGVCQSCLMRVVRGPVPDKAQEGLSPTFVARRLVLACQCFPKADLEVALGDEAIEHFAAEVCAIEPLTEDICELQLRPSGRFEYRAGQFLQLFRDAQTARNYSLASVPDLDRELLLHVGRVPGGQVSGWIFDQLKPGDRVTISEARGNSFYVPGMPDQDLLLIGTGSGLAPLYGIARDALNHGHRGRIDLYHGSRQASGLYLGAALHRLAASHSNFRYGPCIGSPIEPALRDHSDLTGRRVYLCGNPQMVEAARMQTFLAGAASSEIFADPFLPTGAR